MYMGVRFRSCGTVGYGPTMRSKSRQSGDILHGLGSKTFERMACQLCWKQRRYQGQGTKRTIFLLVETRQTNRQSSCPLVATRMLSTIVTWSYLQSCTPIFLPKQGISTDEISQISRKFKRTNGKGKCVLTQVLKYTFPKENRAWYT